MALLVSFVREWFTPVICNVGAVNNFKHAETLMDIHVIEDKLLHVTFQACTVARMPNYFHVKICG